MAGLKTEELKKKSENLGSRDSLYYKLADGSNVLRILPRSLAYFSKEGDNDYAHVYSAHYNLFDVQGYKVVICRQTANQKCPICDYGHSLEDKKKAKIYTASDRYVYNIFDYDSGKIKVFETGPFIYEEILKYVVDPEWGDLFSLKEGRDIKIEVATVPQGQKGKVNPYTVKMVPNKTDVTELLPEKWDEVIDGLKSRMNEVKDEAFYLMIADHLRKGTSPQPIQNDNQEQKKGETAKPAEAKPTGNPACFGIEYSPRADKCRACAVKINCRTVALKLT